MMFDDWVLIVFLVGLPVIAGVLSWYVSIKVKNKKIALASTILALIVCVACLGIGVFVYVDADWGEPTLVETVNLSSIDDNGKYLRQDGLSYVGYVKNGNDFDPLVMLVNNTKLTVDNNETPRADVFVSKMVSDLGFIGFYLSDEGVKSAHVYIPEGGLY